MKDDLRGLVVDGTVAEPVRAIRANRGRRRSLAELLERCEQEIVERWMDQLERTLSNTGISPTGLRDHLPEYLQRLSEELLDDDPALTIEDSGEAAWLGVTESHALTRVRLGFDVRLLQHEQVVLRRVLHETAEAAGILDAEMAGMIAELIEAAAGVAVQSYVAARDHARERGEIELMGFITHELRSPLSTATLTASALRALVAPEQSRSVDVLERSLRRLDTIIQGAQNRQRLSLGQFENLPTLVTLGAVFGELLATSNYAARAKGLTFVAEVDRSIVLEVDPLLTRAALQNVLEIAIKYTDAGSVSIRVDDHGRTILIHVEDTGEALAAEDISTIFEPFSRGHSKKGGTGLGLAVARRAIESQGGQISVKADPAGTRFCLELPKCQSAGLPPTQ